jgi:hypothetical protein
MTIEVRAVIHFFYLLDTRDEDILGRLQSASGDRIVNLKQCSLGRRNFAMGKQILKMNRGHSDPDETTDYQ